MNKLKNLLKDYKKLIDENIDYYLPQQSNRPAIIHEAMRYSALSNGKRIRPILALESLKMLNGKIEEALPSAVAIELAHCFTLVHDDLPSIDNDDLRRGIATNHKKYGNGIALLAGDALLIEAFRIISTYQKPKNIIADITQILSDALSSNGVIGGQITDILAEKQLIEHNENNLKFLHINKTAKLIQSTVQIGATIAGVDPTLYDKLSQAALEIGLAFQIKDDILDVVGEVSKIGKKTGRDAKLGKLTYVKLHGLEESKKMCQKLQMSAINALKPIENSEDLQSIFKFLIEREF